MGGRGGPGGSSLLAQCVTAGQRHRNAFRVLTENVTRRIDGPGQGHIDLPVKISGEKVFTPVEIARLFSKVFVNDRSVITRSGARGITPFNAQNE